MTEPVAVESHLEIERKYDVPQDVAVPDLTPLPTVTAVEGPRELTLEATYFDTEAHDLMRAGVTLRRRTGGDDQGWHLKLPSSRSDREELQSPLRGGATSLGIPRQLRSLVQVHARGRRLSPVATVRNRRVVRVLIGEDGTPLAEFCDDNVTAEVPSRDGSATLSAWREWELELLSGPRSLLDVADAVLLGAGARPSASGSKLGRALGGSSDPVGAADPAPTPKSPAADVLLAHLREQVATLEAYDPRVRRDAHDAVHKMRVSTRRLRSALATFDPLLDEQHSDELRGELKWLAGVLGGARDAEVMRDRLTAMVTEDLLGTTPASAPGRSASMPSEGAANDLATVLAGRYRAAHDEVLRTLDSARYFRLLDALDALVQEPPWAPVASKRADKVLPGFVRRDWRRLEKRATAAARPATPAERDAGLHEVRKAAKRLRYACEAMTPVFGDPAASLGAAAKQLQEVLGEHQDSVVSQQLLRELARHTGMTGDTALVLGRLHLIEQEHAARSLAHYETAWAEASDKRLRRWLRT